MGGKPAASRLLVGTARSACAKLASAEAVIACLVDRILETGPVKERH